MVESMNKLQQPARLPPAIQAVGITSPPRIYIYTGPQRELHYFRPTYRLIIATSFFPRFSPHSSRHPIAVAAVLHDAAHCCHTLALDRCH